MRVLHFYSEYSKTDLGDLLRETDVDTFYCYCPSANNLDRRKSMGTDLLPSRPKKKVFFSLIQLVTLTEEMVSRN